MLGSLKKLGQTVLWEYAPDTPVEKLHRHGRVARAIVYICLSSGAIMISSLVELLLAKGDFWIATLVVLGISGGVVALTGFPATLCVFWACEIEKTLRARSLPLPYGESIEDQLPRFAIKMCFWVAVVIVGLQFVDG